MKTLEINFAMTSPPHTSRLEFHKKVLRQQIFLCESVNTLVAVPNFNKIISKATVTSVLIFK